MQCTFNFNVGGKVFHLPISYVASCMTKVFHGRGFLAYLDRNGCKIGLKNFLWRGGGGGGRDVLERLTIIGGAPPPPTNHPCQPNPPLSLSHQA